MMHGHAIQRLVRQSPRKMRLVMDLIRGKNVNEAYAILQFNKKLAAKQIAKTLKSAVANAEQHAQNANEDFDVDHLVVVDAQVDMGPPLKRFTAAAQGRATPIRKRTSHVKIAVAAKGRSNGSEDASVGFRLGVTSSRCPLLRGEGHAGAAGRRSRFATHPEAARHAAIAEVHIERKPGKVTVTIHTGGRSW